METRSDPTDDAAGPVAWQITAGGKELERLAAGVVEALDKMSNRLYGKLALLAHLLEELVQASLPPMPTAGAWDGEEFRHPTPPLGTFTVGNLRRLLEGFEPHVLVRADGEGLVVGIVGDGKDQKSEIKLLTANR